MSGVFRFVHQVWIFLRNPHTKHIVVQEWGRASNISFFVNPDNVLNNQSSVQWDADFDSLDMHVMSHIYTFYHGKFMVYFANVQ